MAVEIVGITRMWVFSSMNRKGFGGKAERMGGHVWIEIDVEDALRKNEITAKPCSKAS